MTGKEKKELLRELCLVCGPTGSEEKVAELIRGKLDLLGYEYMTDRLGNVIVHIACEGAPRLMVSAHMDEVGFIVNEITEDGYLRFAALGGIDPRVLSGKHIILEGNDGTPVQGIIGSKAIHHQTPDERKTAKKIKDMYIDIGVKKREEAEKFVALGTSGTFDSAFVEFGDGFIKSKAIDDRLGCAIMLDVLGRIKGQNIPLDLYFCFTVREEIGLSGARTAAQALSPEYSVVLESTAVADLPDVTENSRVSELGKGGAVSLRDRSTIYDRGFVRFALSLAEKKNIPAQIKRYVSGGNDAGHIHKSNAGVRALAISAPSRYIHSPACVINEADYFSMGDLLYAIITEFDAEEIKNA